MTAPDGQRGWAGSQHADPKGLYPWDTLLLGPGGGGSAEQQLPLDGCSQTWAATPGGHRLQAPTRSI